MKHKILLLLTVAFTVCVCLYSSESISAARAALALCADALLPSLFVFFVLSGLLLRLGLAEALAKPFSRLLPKLFCVSGSGASALLLGFISGYPVGAVCVKTLYQRGSIGKAEAERLLAFCNNAGPVFVLGTVGSVLLKNARAGWILYLCHILAALTVGVLYRFYLPHEKPRPYARAVFCAAPFGQALSESMHAAVTNIGYVCGFTVFFAVLLAFLPDKLFLRAVLEMTNGCSSICALSIPPADKTRLLSLVLGFGGASVHLQLAGILSDTDLRMSACVTGKLLQAVLSYLYISVLL